MGPYEAIMQQQQAPPKTTMVQGNHDRFPRTQNIGQMQGAEQAMAQMEAQKIELDFMKDAASYQSKKLTQQKSQIQKLMEALKGGV